MLRLKGLQLYNWGFAPFQVPLPIGNITLLQGRNGSGKTTYLNALTLLLGANHLPKRQRFERFVYPDAEWAFLRALADNKPDRQGKRPFDPVFGPMLEETVTLACVLERKSNWQRSYYIIPGDYTPKPQKQPDKQYRFTQHEYRQMLRHVGVRDALLNLLEVGLHGLRDIARDPRSRFDFFLKLVGDEETQERYQSAKQEWYRQREQTVRLEDKLAQDKQNLETMAEAVKIARQRRTWQEALAQATVLEKHAAVHEVDQDVQRLAAEKESITNNLAQTERKLAEQKVKTQQFDTEMAQWEATYHQWQQARDDAETLSRQAQNQATRLEARHEQQATAVTQLRALPEIPLAMVEAALEAAEANYLAARDRLNRLKEQQKSLQVELRQLEANETPLPSFVQRFLQELNAAHISHQLLADVVEVTDPHWLEAVEGALGMERFTVIVADEAQQIRAKEIGEWLAYPAYVSPPNARLQPNAVPDSLWEVVQVSDLQAQGWVQARLARLHRVVDVAAGHRLAQQGQTSITPQAYLQEQRGGRSVKPRELVCGRAAREQRLQQTRVQLSALQQPLQAAETAVTTVHTLRQQAQEQVQQARQRRTLPEAESALLDLAQQLAVARDNSAEREAQYQAIKGQEARWNQGLEQRAAQRTRLTEATRKFEEDYKSQQVRLQDAEKSLSQTERRLRALEAELQPLTAAQQRRFEEEQRTAEAYRQEKEQAERELSQLPEDEFGDINEELYEQQKQSLAYAQQEVSTMRERERQHRQLFDEAVRDFRLHIEALFNQGMNRAFKEFCSLVGAAGEVRVEGAEDMWHMHVRIGFHGKERQSWELAPLSQGQEVMTGLLLVLAALKAVEATSILLLDELMSTLDEVNAPLVLQQLRVTGAQCFVATPHVRPQADVIADVIWSLRPRHREHLHAPPIAALVRQWEEDEPA